MRIYFLAALTLVSACGRAPIDLSQADRQALGPAPQGTQLLETTRADAPPAAVEGAHVVKAGRVPGVRGVFQRWEIPNEAPAGLFADE